MPGDLTPRDQEIVDTPTVHDLLSESHRLEHDGDIGPSLSYARQALDIARDAEDSELIAASLIRVAYVQFRLGRYKEARRTAQEASEIATPSSFAEADALLILGNCAAETTSLTDAEAFYHQAADLSREIDYSLVRMRALHCLGQAVFMPRGQFDLALASDYEAYRIAKEKNLHDWLHFPLVTIA